MDTASKITVCSGDNFACIRINGRANLHSGVDFKTLVNKLTARGCLLIVLELSQCPSMDSTFLGVLAGIGLKLRDAGGSTIELLNPNPRIIELLQSLGVLHLFRIDHGPSTCAFDGQEHEHQPIPVTKAELSRACLEAHQTLMDIHPDNVARFKDVARYLADEVRGGG